LAIRSRRILRSLVEMESLALPILLAGGSLRRDDGWIFDIPRRTESPIAHHGATAVRSWDRLGLLLVTLLLNARR
jgi:hypothetical protein